MAHVHASNQFYKCKHGDYLMRTHQDDFEEITKDIINADAFKKDETNVYLDEKIEKTFQKFIEFILNMQRDGV